MTRNRIFDDPVKKAELTQLLKEGWSYSSIARRFLADHSSIMWHAKRLGMPLLTRQQKGQRMHHGKDLAPIIIPDNLHIPKRTFKDKMQKVSLSPELLASLKDKPRFYEGQRDYTYYLNQARQGQDIIKKYLNQKVPEHRPVTKTPPALTNGE